MSGEQTVLVTGGSGYIGGRCIVALLERGYRVRTTVRSLSREGDVRAAIATVTDPADRLSFHVANLTNDEGWDAATQGCDFVLHIASPLGVPEPKDPNDLIAPARDGALRALKAAVKAGVGRVVMTSSVAATGGSYDAPDGVMDETAWTDPDQPVGGYAKSKTLAERAAWEFIGAQGGQTTLATVNPALVLGPVMGGDFSDSVQVVQRLLTGKMPGLPRLGFNIVDVRDVADLHIRAMTDANAAGRRFIAASNFLWMEEMAALLRRRLGDRAVRVPTRKVPDFVVRLAALFDADLRTVTPGLGRRREFSSAKATNLLGWRPRSAEDTVVDCAESLIVHGAA
ncbi:MAG TPA: aldehyde reductase [Caulobacteraceae bacterium]